MRSPRPDLSLVFPVFNEQANLGPLVTSALALGPKLGCEFEIVLVDDGSQDRSAEVLAELRRQEPRVRVVTHASNRGYGAALRSGLREARGERVFFSDSDLQFDLAEVGNLLAHADRFDIVAGYRSPRRDPWHRRVLAWGWGVCVRLLFDVRVRDIDCAFKVFQRHVLESIPIASLGAFVNTEILVRAQNQGLRIHQVPVTHRPRQHGRQTGAHPRVILRAVRELVSLARELRDPARHATFDPRKPPDLDATGVDPS
ncbi:MAG: glycosyltransferase family 2 protein [Myxococcales bacterium]|nr:glycosyltransferase family 2 protein [Myxococcales bacterium]